MKKFLTILVCLVSFSAFSQGWERQYNIDPANSNSDQISNIRKSMDGNFLTIGALPSNYWMYPHRMFMMKTDAAGDTIWTKMYTVPYSSMYAATDGLLIGSFTELADSSIVAVGLHTYDTLTPYYVHWEYNFHLDKNGNEISYSMQLTNSIQYDFLMAGGGNSYYKGGLDTSTTFMPSYIYPSVKKYSSSGALLWQHVNASSTYYGGIIRSMTMTSDSGVVVEYGYASYSPTDRMHLYKLDKNGNLLWEKNCPNEIHTMMPTSSNGLVIGYTWGYDSDTSAVHFVTEFDSNGDSVAGFQLGYKPLKFVPNQYGGYTVLGYLEGTTWLEMRSFMVAYDASWNVVWQQFNDNSYRIISPAGQNLNPLLRMADNGYMFAGYSWDPLGYTLLPTIFRTDSLGNTYCSSLTGRITDDDNGDCVVNGPDHGYKNSIVKADDGSTAFYQLTNYSGAYAMRVDSGNYVVTHYPRPYRQELCPAVPYNANLLSAYDTINNLDFHDSLTMNFTDVWIDITSPVPPVPGNAYPLTLTYGNYGTDTASGTVSFTFDPLFSFVSSSTVPSSVSGTTLTYNYNGLSEDSTVVITINLMTDTTAVLGDTIDMYSDITSVNPDVDSMNNQYDFYDVVVSSYDPNDKAVSPQGTGAQGFIAGVERLEYLVRFQNTGSYLAQNIVVRDTISDNLDLSTFQFISSSHSCVPSIINGRTMYFTFNNIDLPDSTSNEAASHGFVKYSILPKGGLSPGTQIKNTASIYFDFNLPVVTNTTLNTIAFPASVEEQDPTGNVMVYPNPFSATTTFVISSQESEHSFELTDVLGRKVMSLDRIAGKQFTISRDGLEDGVYFYTIRSGNNAVGVGKLIVQ